MSWPPQESEEIQKAFAALCAALWWLDVVAVVAFQILAILYVYEGRADHSDARGYFYLAAMLAEAIAIGLAIPLISILAWRWLRRRRRATRTMGG